MLAFLFLCSMQVFSKEINDCPSEWTVACNLDCFKKQMKNQENTNVGYRNGKWYPYPSIEGGTDTIAWGHKLKKGEDFSKGITDAKANEIFELDFQNAKNQAKKDYDNVYGAGKFAKLAAYKQYVSTDIAFNVGSLKGFPSFMRAMNENNLKNMLRECTCANLPRRNKWRQCYIQTNYF